MTLLRLDYLVYSFGNCVMTLSNETGLNVSFVEDFMVLNIINFADMARRENDEFHEM